MATKVALSTRSTVPDAVRGAAALLVAAGHAWQVFLLPFTGKSIGMTIMGGLATWSVAVFFMLSGMLIGGSIRNRISAGAFSLREYALSRFLRIYPPLIVAVLVSIFCVLVISVFDLYGADAYLLEGDLGSARGNAAIDWWSVLTTLTLTYQLIPGHGFIFFNGPLWSLSFEAWMYALAGLASFAVVRGSLVCWLATAILVYIMLFVSITAHPPFWAVGLIWGFGFLYGWGGKTGMFLFTKRKQLGAVALVICLAVANTEFLQFLPAPYNGVQQHIFYVSFSAVVFCGLISLLQSVRFEKSAVCQTLASAAAYSYTLYLLHFPLFLLSLSIFRPSFISLGLQGAVGLAAISLAAVCMISWWVARYAEDRSVQIRLAKACIFHVTSKLRHLQRTG